ncbi:MAG: ribose 5-phosphate isomerase B [Chloroflexi bacterium]|jgi:ribose 5-phosphate isomerase B|nr:ribose 5-phosphate isomerase B [Chloroflexota bacterium]MBT7082352.1 ribose 5-phosphate isomerase B [Chloroflexota bacterium]MBT7289570.1 ribose 5-phosphate isomerase B [Chloroflexota bacterium]
MRIAVGSDHAGLKLKAAVISYLSELEHTYDDFGAYDTNSVDYPDISRAVCGSILEKKHDLGILICSTGVGISIAANKINGIRAALCHDTFAAARAREHTDCNVLCMGEWCIGQGIGRAIVKAFLDGEFVGGRHGRRLEKLTNLETEQLQ